MESNGKNQQSGQLLSGVLQFGWIGFFAAVMTAGFYIYLLQGPLPPGPWQRYFTGHWVEYVEASLFFVAFSALLSHAWTVAAQFSLIDTVALEPIPRGGQRPDEAPRLLEALDEAAAGTDTYLTRRLRDALEHVDRTGSADQLDGHLKYLADNDAIRQSENYSLSMLIVWAIPMLGFLGTVIGITEALGNLSPEALIAGGDKGKEALQGMLAGLYVAFDTTAVALMFALTLMFIKFLIEQSEGQLLSRVDLRVNETLLGRFQQLGAGNDPHLASVQRMSETVVAGCEALVRKQTELWQSTIDAAHQQWSSLLDSAGQHVETALVGALEKSIDSHTQHLTRFEQAAQERSLAHGDQLRSILRENADVLREHQGEMIRQTEVLARAVAATSDVVKLEAALNSNLQTLAGSRHFEETVMSLAATIHLLNTRLSELPLHDKSVSLTPARAQGRAA